MLLAEHGTSPRSSFLRGTWAATAVSNVLEDRDTFLCYADQEMLTFVMLFNQPRTQTADRQMEAMTLDPIDTAITCGGRYYLPYRLHATKEQFEMAYPRAAEFLSANAGSIRVGCL